VASARGRLRALSPPRTAMETTLRIGPSFTIEAAGRGKLCECPVWMLLWIACLSLPFCRWFVKCEALLPPLAFEVGLALYASATFVLLVAAHIDPGTVPRNVAWRPPGETPLGVTAPPSEALAPPGMAGRISVHRGVELRHKFCTSCGVVRPIRAVHCRMTDRCVEKWDHYCWYLGITVGRRNHPWYFSFLLLALLDTLYMGGTGGYALELIVLRDAPNENPIAYLLWTDPLSCSLLCYALLMSGVLLNLVTYHAHNISVNLTTYEKFRRPYSRPRTRTTECLSPGGNPFDAGFFRNWAEAFFPCFVRPPMCVLASTEEIKDLEAPNMLLRGQQGPMLTSTASWTE